MNKWIWLILFLVLAGLGVYRWTSKGEQTPEDPQVEAPPASDADTLPLEEGFKSAPSVPSVPGARQKPEFRRPQPSEVEPPGFASPPPVPLDSGPTSDGEPPGSAFEALPPPAFENPEFITPPPPPPQFDSEFVPFDEEGAAPPEVPQEAFPPTVDDEAFPIMPED